MKVFHCDHCGDLLFFENTVCLKCAHRVAYLPDLALVGSLDADVNDANLWRSPLRAAADRVYRLCLNYTEQEVCNWVVDAGDSNPLCLSCRLTRVIPDLREPGVRQAWYRLEAAKRRLVYTLLSAGLPVRNRDEDPTGGLAFEFKADPPAGGERVMTGHADGVITINIAEADDAEREKRRTALNEQFRTLLGHVRHESGHYYWDRLIRDGNATEACRVIFGDEREDYGQAIEAYYRQGPPPDWQERFVSAYATAHPWEDWAETWAHYLHMIDTLEMAATCGLSLRPRRSDEPSMPELAAPDVSPHSPFDRLIESWFPVAYVLNNLNRGLGQPDGYPFVLSTPVLEKLRYIHEVVGRAAESSASR
jgi:hypothetical protein